MKASVKPKYMVANKANCKWFNLDFLLTILLALVHLLTNHMQIVCIATCKASARHLPRVFFISKPLAKVFWPLKHTTQA